MTETLEPATFDPTPALDQLAAALAGFQAEMPVVPKTKTAKVQTRDGGNYSYKYADLADLTAAAMPILAKHGLAFVCRPGPTGLVGLLIHTSGQRLEAVLPINGATPQQVGSSLTYMRRYLLGCLTGLVTDDDDDGQAAEAKPKRRPNITTGAVAPVPVAPPLATERNPAPDGSVDVPLPEPEPARVVSSPVPPQVMKAFHATWGEVFPESQTREDRVAILATIIGREVASSADLTRNEVFTAIGFLERMRAGVAGVVRRDGTWQAVTYDEEPPEER